MPYSNPFSSINLSEAGIVPSVTSTYRANTNFNGFSSTTSSASSSFTQLNPSIVLGPLGTLIQVDNEWFEESALEKLTEPYT